MKKIIKVLVIVLLVGVLCFEGFLMLKKDKTEEKTTNEEVVYKKIVSDATKTYRKNGLEFNIESEDGYYYHQISGLKDKDIQKKVNKLIKNRTKEAMKNIDEDEDYNTVTSIRGSFSNILSLEIGLGPAPSLIDSYVYVVYDVLNIDLNTGNELTIDDITLSVEGLREPLYKGIEETATYYQGFAGIMTTNKYAKYERVEDAALSVMNKFNSKNYMFTINEQGIMLYFNDVYINTPEYIYFVEEDFDEYTEEELKHFENSCLKEEDEDGYGYFYCDDKYETTYDIFIPLNYIADDFIVYDTYVKDESIFKEDGEEFLRYVNDETENRIRKITMYEEDNNIYEFGGIDEFDFDFSEDNEYCNMPFSKFKEMVLNDIKDDINGENNVIYIGLEIREFNDACSIIANSYVYKLDEETIDKYKNKIYTDFLGRYYEYDRGYEFLSEYTPKKKVITYLLDEETYEPVEAYTIINPRIDLKKYIPNKWIKDGKTKDDIIKSAYVTTGGKVIYKDRLGINYYYGGNGYGTSYSLLYNGETVYFEEDLEEGLLAYGVDEEED